MNVNNHIQELITLSRQVEVDDAVIYLDKLSEKYGEEFVINEIIGKLLTTIGEIWEEEGGFSLAETYVTSKIVIKYLENKSKISKKTDKNKKAIFGNIKNDFHSSGRKMVIRFLELDGWDVLDLGNDVEPEVFVNIAKEKGIRFIGVSSMLYENALNIKELVKLVEEEYKNNDKPYIIAGGAIFNVVSSLSKELNVKYTAKNSLEARKLFNRLYMEV